MCEITSAVFQASDLAGAKRREFLGAAREGGALLRDTDGFALTMIPLAQLEAVTEIAQVAVAALLALAALGRGSTRPADFGQLAWLAAFDEDDRAEFFEELRDALSIAAATRDAGARRDVPAGVAHDRPGAVGSAAAGHPDRAGRR